MALGVVMAAEGYPDNPRKGDEITGSIPSRRSDPDVHVFHAGTRLEDGNVVTSGGRVLCVTALGDTVRVAQRAAYEVVSAIHFDGRQYRTDIGYRAMSPRSYEPKRRPERELAPKRSVRCVVLFAPNRAD